MASIDTYYDINEEDIDAYDDINEEDVDTYDNSNEEEPIACPRSLCDKEERVNDGWLTIPDP